MDALRDSLSSALGLGVTELAPLPGGDINRAYRAELADGSRCFVKTNCWELLAMFEAEAEALREIARSDTLRVPSPLAIGSEREHAYLVLGWLSLRRADALGAAAFGRGLAAMHAVREARYGWHRDNTLGSAPQANAWSDDWVSFWRDRRLGPQLALAVGNGYGPELAEPGAGLMDALDEILADHRPPAALLHGDLWAGNWGVTTEGAPALYDPALYYGDPETDLAMMALFGGFPQACWDAYYARNPPLPGWERRRQLYQLHHVLNHANLFGGGYLAQAVAIIERLVGW